MVKKILSLILGLMLLSTFVLAVPSPEPVAIQVGLVGYPDPEGLKLIHTNLRTGISYESEVDSSGFSLMDWGNNPHLPGDKVEIAIKVCRTNPVCKKEITLSGEPLLIDLVVPSLTEIQQEVIKEVGYKYVCADKSIKDTADECPEVQSVIVPSQVLVCQDGTKVTEEKDCPSDPLLALSIGLGALLVVAGAVLAKYKWGKGFVATAVALKKKGDVAAKNGDKALAEKYYTQAQKQLTTAIEKDKKGLYKK